MSSIHVTNVKDASGNAALVTESGGVKTDKLTGITTAGSISVVGEGNSTTTNLQQGLAKVWGNCGSDAAITDSLNLASGTDDGTGDYSYAITNAFSNVTAYALSGAVSESAGGIILTRNSSRDEAGVIGVETSDNDGSARNADQDFSVHGDLA